MIHALPRGKTVEVLNSNSLLSPISDFLILLMLENTSLVVLQIFMTRVSNITKARIKWNSLIVMARGWKWRWLDLSCFLSHNCEKELWKIQKKVYSISPNVIIFLRKHFLNHFITLSFPLCAMTNSQWTNLILKCTLDSNL